MRTRILAVFLFLIPTAFALAQTPQTTAPNPKPAVETQKSAGESSAPQKPVAETPKPPQADASAEQMPTTTILDKSAPGERSTTTDGSDALFEPKPLPRGKVSLIGGTVRSIDRVRNRITVQAFGGKAMKVRFDDRTHIYRDGVETTQLGIRKGDRIYVDSMLDTPNILARNVHVVTELQPADARGQLMQFNDRQQMMVVQDQLSQQPVRFRVDNSTVVKRMGAAGSVGDLIPGSLIEVLFSPDKTSRGLAKKVTIYASPGTLYTFAGEITHLNLALGSLAIHNTSDDKSYEIQFDPSMSTDTLQLGAQATIMAQFTGRNYKASQIQVTQSAAKEQ